MSLKILFLAILLALVLLLIGCSVKNPCESMANIIDKDDCYFNDAVEKTGLKSCSFIQSAIVKNSCIAEIGIANQDIGICNSIEGKSRDYCIAKIAIFKEDFDLCNSISADEYWSDICNRELAIKKNESSRCVKVINFLDKDSCYDTIARTTLNAATCFYIRNETTHDQCISKVAVTKLNESLCEETKGVLIGDICYSKIAQIKKNESICDGASYWEIKNACKAMVKSILNQTNKE